MIKQIKAKPHDTIPFQRTSIFKPITSMSTLRMIKNAVRYRFKHNTPVYKFMLLIPSYTIHIMIIHFIKFKLILALLISASLSFIHFTGWIQQSIFNIEIIKGESITVKFRSLYVFIALICLLILTSCAEYTKNRNSLGAKAILEDEPVKESPEVQEPDPIEKEITISAVGDILIHSRVYNDAKVEEGYNFIPMLEQVKPYLNDTTITIANQETMIGGVELGLSTYPAFNSPQELGDALKEVGVDVVSIANNHTLDRGEKAIQSAIRHWEKIDMMYVGAHKDPSDQERIRIYETDEDIAVAFLSYTYGTNGIPIPDGKDFLVNLIDRESLIKDVAKAREKADAIVLSLHFGTEYERMPNEEQKDLVQFAADLGVDVVLGHHPHVLQPMEWVRGVNGNKTFVIYSLGNFLSGQDEYFRQVGGIVKFTIQKTIKGDEETISIHSPKFMPTYVKSENDTNYKVIPMFRLTASDLANARQHYDEIKIHMSQWMPELQFIEE